MADRDASAAPDGAPPGTLDDARLDLRVAGYCVACDRIVVREPDGSCPASHPAEAVSGRIVLFDEDPVPSLPRFNLAAFLLPFVWGPAHGQWVGALFLPIWLFADAIVSEAGRGGIATRIGAIAVVALTLVFQAFFAKRANGVAFRRVLDHQTAEEFARKQRLWAAAAVPAAAVLLALAIWWHVAHSTVPL